MNVDRIKIEANTNEWLSSRLGKFSSSELYKLMQPGKGKAFTETGISYIHETVSDVLSDQIKHQAKAASLDFGHNYESEALQAFSNATGYRVDTGMAYHWEDKFCGTPDGEADGKYILEVKCPFNGGNHIENFQIGNAEDLKRIRKEYYWQIVGNILLSGYASGYFISYNPRLAGDLKLHIAQITPMSEDLLKAKNRILLADSYKTEIILSLV